MWQQPCNNQTVLRGHHFGGHSKTRYKKLVTHVESHASAVSTPLRWILKNVLQNASHSCRITCERSESARERRTNSATYKRDQQQQQHYLVHTLLPTVQLTGLGITNRLEGMAERRAAGLTVFVEMVRPAVLGGRVVLTWSGGGL